MTYIIDDLGGICPACAHRFRRVFEPSDLDNFQDEEGNPISDYMDSGVIVLDICLLTDIPMGQDSTYSCSHFTPKEDEADEDDDYVTLFRHLKIK